MKRVLGIIFIIFIFTSTSNSQFLYKIKKDLTLGKNIGNEEYEFHRISDVKVDKAGNIYVLDRESCNVFKFNPYGVLLKTIGKKGEGFGEFREPLQIQFGKDGKIFVRDKSLKRIVVFSPDGKYYDMLRFVDLNIIDFYPLEKGKIIIVYIEEPDNIKIGICNTKGELKKNIITLQGYKKYHIGAGNYTIPDYFYGRPFWAFSPDGLIFAGFSNEYIINIYNMDGKKTGKIERKYTPLELSSKEREWYFKRFGVPEKDKKKINLPEFKAPFDRIYIDDNGNIWVRTLNIITGNVKEYDILDKNGNFISKIRIKGRLCDFWKNFIYVIDYSSFGLPFVTKYKVEKNNKKQPKR